MSNTVLSVCRLRVLTEDNPGALARVLERFQNLNILPRRIVAETGSHGAVHVAIDVSGVPEDTLSLITAKIAQVACVLEASWHRV